MTGGILEVEPPPVVVDLIRPLVSRVGPIRQPTLGDSEEDGDKEEGDVSSLEGEQGSEEEEEEENLLPNPLKKKTYNANHLPDELFTAAFASKASTSKRKALDDEEDNPPKMTPKKPKRSHSRKDLLIVGYAF